MDSCTSLRYVTRLIALLCCILPVTRSLDLEALLEQVDPGSVDGYVDNGGPADSRFLSTQAMGNPTANPFETTGHRFIATKRGWDVIEKIWQPQFPKRAWEFVDRVWKIPRFRKKYLRYLQPTKRSREFTFNVPLQYETRTNTGRPVYDSLVDKYQDSPETYGGDHVINLLDRDWLTAVKELLCSCCLKHPGGSCCENCRSFVLRK